MHSGVDAHRRLIGILPGDAFVHLEEVAVAVADGILAQPLDGIGEVQVDGQFGLPYPAAFVADVFGVARGHIPWNQVAVRGIAPFQVIIALGLGDVVGMAVITGFFGHPHPSVIAQTLAHQRQFGLIIAGNRDAGGVDLGKVGIGKEGALFVAAPGGGGIGIFGIGGKVIDIAVTAGTEQHRVTAVGFDLAGDQIAHHDAAGLAVDHHQVEHLPPGEEFHPAEVDLAHHRPVGAQQ